MRQSELISRIAIIRPDLKGTAVTRRVVNTVRKKLLSIRGGPIILSVAQYYDLRIAPSSLNRVVAERALQSCRRGTSHVAAGGTLLSRLISVIYSLVYGQSASNTDRPLYTTAFGLNDIHEFIHFFSESL